MTPNFFAALDMDLGGVNRRSRVAYGVVDENGGGPGPPPQKASGQNEPSLRTEARLRLYYPLIGFTTYCSLDHHRVPVFSASHALIRD
jgi:hypothetical protein